MLELLLSEELVLQHAIRGNSVCPFTWIIMRRMKLSSLVVALHTNLGSLTTYLDHSAHHVRSLEFCSSDKHAEVIISRCKYIEDLSFEVVMVKLGEILASNPNITSLRFRNSPLSQAELFSSIKMPKLTTLHLSSKDDAVLVAAVGMTENLTRLVLCGQPFVSVSSVIVAAIAKNCPKLRSLGLNGIGVSNEDLAELAHGCPQIINLSLGNTMALTDEGILHLAQSLKLRALHLHTSVLTDLSLQYLSEHCADTLQVVNLTGFMLAPAVEDMKAKCHKMRTFHWPNEVFHPQALFSLEQATILSIMLDMVDQALVVLSQYSKIQILDLTRIVGDCSKLTQDAVSTFVEACPALRTIVVNQEDKAVLVNMVKDFAWVRVTTDTSVLEFDVLSMPL